MDFHEQIPFIKQSQEELLLSDTQIEIPGPHDELQKQFQSLLSERASLKFAKTLAEKQACAIINNEIYQRLIKLNQTNLKLREEYKSLMKDRQLKKENYYQEKQNNSMGGSEIFTSIGSSRLQQLTTPKHGSYRNLVTTKKQERKSFCPARKPNTYGRQSFGLKAKTKAVQAQVQSSNIFLNLFNLIVEQQKQTQKQILGYFVKDKIGNKISIQDGTHLSNMETYLQQAHIKIDKMVCLIKLYQEKLDKSTKQCDQMQNIIQQFSTAQLKLDSISNKIKNLPSIRQQIELKQNFLQNNMNTKLKPQSLQNLQLLLKVLQFDNGGQMQMIQFLSSQCSKLIVDPRQSKIKMLQQSIRTGRQKFKQIYNIYMERVKVLESKLLNFK